MNMFGPVLDTLHDIAKDESQKCNSQILQGTVVSIDPLSIELENGEILPSKKFYLSDFCIAKKVKLRVHQIYGQPKEITFEGDADILSGEFVADAVSKSVQAQMIAKTKAASNLSNTMTAPTGTWSATAHPPEGPPEGVGVGDTNLSIDLNAQSTNIKSDATDTDSNTQLLDVSGEIEVKEPAAKGALSDNIDFKIEVKEEEPHEFQLDTPKDHPHKDQTTVIEGVLWRGLQPGDIVLMTSHNEKQLYFVHRILNREREQYEHGIAWDSRLIDGRGTDGVTAGFDGNMPRHSLV